MTTISCLSDPYKKTLDTEVLACVPDGDQFLVRMADTVLYPEGGGQPADHGLIHSTPVLDVQRDSEGIVWHQCTAAQPTGPCRVTLDWDRRYDHMQQHTGQHLLSAVAFDLFGFNTTAFHLGTRHSAIELDVASISNEQRRALQDSVNAHIRAARPVTLRTVTRDELSSMQLRCRGLPDHLKGAIRLIEIEGVDLNACGGTHLASTSEIQAITLLQTESIRGGTRLFFLAGQRVLAAFDHTRILHDQLTRHLSVGPEGYLDALQKLTDDRKNQTKVAEQLARELTSHIGKTLAQTDGNLASLHRPSGDLGFLNRIAAATRNERPDLLLLLTSGNPQGCFLLSGPPEWIQTVRAQTLNILEARGGGRPGLLQGRAKRLDQRESLLAYLHTALNP